MNPWVQLFLVFLVFHDKFLVFNYQLFDVVVFSVQAIQLSIYLVKKTYISIDTYLCIDILVKDINFTFSMVDFVRLAMVISLFLYLFYSVCVCVCVFFKTLERFKKHLHFKIPCFFKNFPYFFKNSPFEKNFIMFKN